MEHFSDMLLNEKQKQNPSGEAASYVVTGANAISVSENGQQKKQQQQQQMGKKLEIIKLN